MVHLNRGFFAQKIVKMADFGRNPHLWSILDPVSNDSTWTVLKRTVISIWLYCNFRQSLIIYITSPAFKCLLPHAETPQAGEHRNSASSPLLPRKLHAIQPPKLLLILTSGLGTWWRWCPFKALRRQPQHPVPCGRRRRGHRRHRRPRRRSSAVTFWYL